MKNNSNSNSEIVQKKSKIPYIFFGFFAVVILVNIFYIYLSHSTWRGVFTNDSYRKGLNYNQAIQFAKRQKELGWKAEISYNRVNQTSGVFTVVLLDRNHQPIKNASMFFNLKRPSQEGADFSQKLVLEGGVHKALVQFPLQGQWDVELVAKGNQEIFQEVRRYVIQ